MQSSGPRWIFLEEEDEDEDEIVIPDRPKQDHTLVNRLLQAFKEENIHDSVQKYVPLDSLIQVITKTAIHEELNKINKEDEQGAGNFDEGQRLKLASWVSSRARQVFAAVLLCDLSALDLLLTMRLAKRYEFVDDLLPVPGNPGRDADIWLRRFNRKIWTELKLERFHTQQWAVNAATFDQWKLHYEFQDKTVFPFNRIGMPSEDGTFSRVYRIKIHDAHKNFPTPGDIALKELRVQNAPVNEEQRQINQAWENEAGTLEAINELEHNHIIRCVATIRRGNGRYFMFPWATGGSLRDFWEKAPRIPPNADIILQAVKQLRGIADALDKLHHFHGGRSRNQPREHKKTPDNQDKRADGEQPSAINPQVVLDNEIDDYHDAKTAASIRHGDLKPENILRFSDEPLDLGLLQLADMGLAKRHVVATQVRSNGTNTRWSTRLYEAPEVQSDKNARSRLYDVWSMGCITLEFLIWILYGNGELKKLYNDKKGFKQLHRYYTVTQPIEDGPHGPRLHPLVNRWMNYIEQSDPECNIDGSSAIKDLLAIVREKLLIVPLSPDRLSGIGRGRTLAMPTLGQEVTRYRATAAEFRDALDKILANKDIKSYLFTGSDRTSLKPPSVGISSSLSIGDRNLSSPAAPQGDMSSNESSGAMNLDRPIATDYALPTLQGWRFEVDNEFVERFLEEVGWDVLSLSERDAPKLCPSCKALYFWKGGFSIEDKATELAARTRFCELCAMLHEPFSQSTASKGQIARFERDQASTMVLTGDQFPVLSLFRTTELKTQLDIQIGFPILPEPGTSTYYSLLGNWLNECNDNHQGCKVPTRSLPTRLIDVGALNSKTLRLVTTESERPIDNRYIALSHPWGDPNVHEPFRTLRTNVIEYGHCIPENQLPQTFKDAVECTRALRIRYLWIDSICIIQGDDGDFNVESSNMEKVFSGAYCVLAASRAKGQHDGFLGSRAPREYLTFQHEKENPFHIGRMMDDFTTDVIQGSLNKRGWVLQERILARRTIYFTDKQTYFECGNGVRCETLAKKRNEMVDYLADPKFPEKIMNANRASKISSFQSLYRQYSRLDFSHDEDRPFAIAGLEARLQDALATKGKFGIFDDGDATDGGLFHRSLLWQRGEEADDKDFMSPIIFRKYRDINIPSWSWMGNKGGIDYIDPPWESAEWEMNEIIPPWTKRKPSLSQEKSSDEPIRISARVRDYNVSGRRYDEVKLEFDTGETSLFENERPQCVIVAKAKLPTAPREKRFYVVLVAWTGQKSEQLERVYKRVGAGYMLGKFITLEGNGLAARIV